MNGHRVFKGIVEDRNDPLKLGRARVRIIGHHSENKTAIPTESLPWAAIMQPVTSAAMNGIGTSPLGVVEGTTVLVIFNDESDMQDPIIIGTVGGIPKGANFVNPSDMKSTKSTKKAVFNGGIETTGVKINPLKEISKIKGRQVDLLVIHCTATKPKQDIGVAEIDEWHRARGWNGIGYHAVIRRNGTTEQGRDVSKIGAHTFGYNKRSIGVSLVGGIDSNNNAQNNFTQAQFTALRTYVDEFLIAVPNGKIIGHNEVSNKACPSFNVQEWLAGNLDGATADQSFLTSYNEEDIIDGARQADSGENQSDLGKTEAFGDDVTSGKAKTNILYPEGGLGFNDPNGVYPKETHLNEPDTNRLARNENISETIVKIKKDNIDSTTSAFGVSIDEPETEYAAQYPFNHVRESESGHIQEFDDTPGAERIHQYHRTGTFEEIHPDGTKVTKIIGNNYEIVHGNGNLHVKGNINITIDGDTNMKINGETNLESVGNITAHTDKNFKLTADGTVDIVAQGNMTLRGTIIDLNP